MSDSVMLRLRLRLRLRIRIDNDEQCLAGEERWMR
jgi:hypothetical protein